MSLRRERHTITERDGVYTVIDGKRVLNFCSNDYLGIATHEAIVKSFIMGAEKYGLGSGASPIVSGYFNAHQAFEEAMANYLGHERALLFSSGYAANISIMRAITTRSDIIASDKLCHASLIDGICLSLAKHKRFRHQDIAHALSFQPTHLVTESIFSMEGNITRLPVLNNIVTILDTAHSVGLDIAPHYPMIDYTISPLGKAFGSLGGVISGSHDRMETLLQRGRAYHYSTALPPAIAHANLTALDIIQTEHWRQEKLKSLIQYFLKEARARDIPLISNDPTPIKAILIQDNDKTMRIKNALLANGMWIGGIRPPTVPKNTARLRICLSALHEEKHIAHLLDLVRDRL